MKLILTAVFLLGILAVMELTPLGDYLFSEERITILIIGGVVILCIAGIILMEGFWRFVMGGAIGSIIFSVVIKVAQIGNIPILVLAVILLLRKAFGSRKKMKEKHDAWIAENKVIESIEEIRPYVVFIRNRARQVNKDVMNSNILKYYDEVLEKLDFYDRLK